MLPFIDTGKVAKAKQLSDGGALSPSNASTHNNPPDIINFMLSPSGGTSHSRGSSRKGLDPQKVKQDILRALADPALSKDLLSIADEVLDKKRQK